MEETIGPETSVSNHINTPGNNPKEDKQHISNYGESLNFNKLKVAKTN
jgi:hypothetical protein